MGSRRRKRLGNGADLTLKSSGQDNVLDSHVGSGEQNYCEFNQQANYEGDFGQDEMYEDCRQHQRKRPRRVSKTLVDLSEYEKFCVDPACTPACYQLPCKVLDVKGHSAGVVGDSLHLSVAEISQVASASVVNSQARGIGGHGCGNKQLHLHEYAEESDDDHECTSYEQKLMDCKLKIMVTRLNYGVDVWSLAAQLVNPYEVLPSIAVRVLNRAFFKMWELMQMFPGLVPPVATMPKLLSAHMCEGPGGFIQAVRMLRWQDMKGEESKRIGSLSSAVYSSSDIKKTGDSWFAITLASPGGENDGLKMQTSKIQEFMSESVEGHVHYGADESGDVMNPDNISAFVQFVLRKTGGEKMHLITGDGAFDISDDFSLQEQNHGHLFFCEILLAARLQCPGGALVLKVFDCFTETTTALLYILASLYTSVEIVRLRTSRVCSSERFVVAQGFRSLSKSLEDKLMSISTAWYESTGVGLLATVKVSRPYPPSFIEALNQGNAAVANGQSESILQAVAVAEDLGERLSFTSTSHHKGILGILRRKIKNIELLRCNALSLCKTLNIALANSIEGLSSMKPIHCANY